MSRKNRFPGINPQLNSLLQSPGTEEQPTLWHTFHTSHIAHIVDFLNDQLPDNYAAYPEQSLQTREFDSSGTVTLRRPEPDVTVFQESPSSGVQVAAVSGSPTWQMDIIEVLEPLKHPAAAIIREASTQSELGQIVTRIELLSPSNKRPGSPYFTKRIEALQSGLPLVEIDYLHEQPPVVSKLPVYPHEPGSYPYYIAVSDPRPVWEEGVVSVYGFGVDDPAATFPLPLMDDEKLLFDLNAVYQHTFERGRWSHHVDYAQRPVRWETYHSEALAYMQQSR